MYLKLVYLKVFNEMEKVVKYYIYYVDRVFFDFFYV